MTRDYGLTGCGAYGGNASSGRGAHYPATFPSPPPPSSHSFGTARQVYACAAAASAAGLTRPQTYDAVGLLYCGINSAKPGSYQVVYSVTSGSSGAFVTTSRTVIVFTACDAGTTLCQDGSCSNGGVMVAGRVSLALHSFCLVVSRARYLQLSSTPPSFLVSAE